MDFTYDGSATAPAAAGSYTVIGTVNNANYQGLATNTLVIGKATATVTLGSLSQTYDGTAKSVTATTVPASLTVDFTYDGSATAPAAAGSYTVVGTVNNANYHGSATNTLVIGKATAIVTLGSLSQTYDGMAKTVTATTDPAGLAMDFTYDGSATAPAAAGSYTVAGTVNEANYHGSATNTLVIGKATATVTTWPAATAITYGQTLAAATLSGGAASVAGSFAFTTPGTAPAAGTTAQAVTFTPTDSANYNLVSGTVSVTVNQAILTVTADNQARGYGLTNPALTLGYTGFVNGEDASVLTTLPVAATLATAASPANTYALTVTGGSATNYTLSLVAGTLTVTQAVLVATADAQGRPYGATNPPLTLTYTGFRLGEGTGVLTTQPVAQTVATPGSPVGTYPITVTGGSAANYALTLVDGVLTVNPVPLSITASNASRSWGQPNPVFAGSLVGTQGSDVIAVSYTCLAVTNSPVGTYPIVPSLDDPSGVVTNYSVSLSNGVLSVTFDGAALISLSQDPWLYTVGLDPMLLEMFGLEDKLLDTDAQVSDSGGAHFGGGTLTVDLSVNANVADALAVLPEGSGAGQIDVVGDTVTYGGVAFGTLAGGTNGGALTFNFNPNATPAVVQALLRCLAFSSTDESTNNRTVRMVIADGVGGVSAPATRWLGINRSPVTVDRYVTVRESVNTSLSIAWIIAEATDADNDPITLTASSLVSGNGGRIVKSGTNLVYRPAAGFVGQDVFAYIVIDGRGGESTGLVWLNVLKQNTLRLEPNSVQASSPAVRIQMAGLPGQTYGIEVSADLIHWSLLTTAVANPDGIVEVLDAAARTEPQRFYRAVTP